ncbi:hypothetical protein ACA910_006381 [Epithemia clementina (nom. ined.)]
MVLLTNDSEHSPRSTFATDEGIHKPLHEQQCVASASQRRRKTKHVSLFDESSNQSFAYVEKVAEDCREKSWYIKADFQNMRAEMQSTIQELQRKDKTMHSPLSKTLKALFNLVSSVDYIVEDLSSIVGANIQQMLSQLYTQGQDSCDLIGLEMHVEGRLRRTAKEHREYTQEVVYDIQKEYQTGLLDEEKVHFELCESCLNYLQAFGLLAQIKVLAQLFAQ